MKKILYSVVAALALTLGSAAFAQSTPSSDKSPPPAGSPGSDTAGAPTTGSQPPKTESARKTGKSKQGTSDTSPDKTGATKY
jgi:hypothetical protein